MNPSPPLDTYLTFWYREWDQHYFYYSHTVSNRIRLTFATHVLTFLTAGIFVCTNAIPGLHFCLLRTHLETYRSDLSGKVEHENTSISRTMGSMVWCETASFRHVRFPRQVYLQMCCGLQLFKHISQWSMCLHICKRPNNPCADAFRATISDGRHENSTYVFSLPPSLKSHFHVLLTF